MNNRWVIAAMILLPVLAFPARAASTSFGSTDATRCFEESRYRVSDNGLEHCDRALASGDLTRRDRAATHSNRGIILAANGRFADAMAAHNTALELEPELAAAYVNRGNVYYHQRDFERALQDYDTAARLGSRPLATSHFNRGLALLKLKRLGEARAAFETALGHAPDSEVIKRQLARFEDR